MLPFPDVMHFLANKLARLGGRRFSLALILPSRFDGFGFWHGTSPLFS
jgi:hypothetical protein